MLPTSLSFMLALLIGFALAAVRSAAKPPPVVLYYTYYQDPWCTADNANQKVCCWPPSPTCSVQGCCDERVVPFRTLLDPVSWPSCKSAGGVEGPVNAESVLISIVAPNEKGGLDFDLLGQYYAAGATFFDAAGAEKDWKTSRGAVPCGGPKHDTPYSYLIPHGKPALGPLCVPATPPAALKSAIDGLTARGIRPGISLLGGAGGDIVPLPNRSHISNLSSLPENRWLAFMDQLRAAATVLNGWGVTHFDVDFEGGISVLNATRLSQMVTALRFDGGLVSLTTEVYALDSVTSLLNSTDAPDMVQLMMGNYGESLASGLSQAQGVSNRTGYPISRFRLGIKPQCGVEVGSIEYLKTALPKLVESGAGAMFWNLGRDYSCAATTTCSKAGPGDASCKTNTSAGQAPFTNSPPFAFACAISEAFSAAKSPMVVAI